MYVYAYMCVMLLLTSALMRWSIGALQTKRWNRDANRLQSDLTDDARGEAYNTIRITLESQVESSSARIKSNAYRNTFSVV